MGQNQESKALSQGTEHDVLKDGVIGIDVEWKPDSNCETNDVALMQLASQSAVVLLRLCKLDGFPEAVLDFCRSEFLLNTRDRQSQKLPSQETSCAEDPS